MSQEPTNGAPADLRIYLAMLRRHKIVILATLGLVIAATFAFTAQQVPQFTSTTRVLVKATGVSNSYNRVESAALKTEAGIASSGVVAQVVKDNIGTSESIDTLLSGLSVADQTDTEFLDVSYTSPDPARAKDLSGAFAQAYLDYRTAQATDEIAQQVKPYASELADLQKQMPGLIKKIQGTKDAGVLATLNGQLSYATGRMGYLRQTMLPFDGALTDGGDIVVAPNLPTTPSSPSYPRNLALAIVVGLALGIGAAFVRERLDDRLRGSRDLESAIGAPILATIPKVAGWKERSHTVMSSVATPRGPVAEAYKTMRTNLQFIAKDEGFQILSITSATAGEGKTTTVANLAVTLAQTGSRVMAISCDLRKPRLHTFFGLSNAVGLTSILTGRATLADAAQAPMDLGTLRLIASGPVPSNPAELLGSTQMDDLLRELRRYADFILIDLPPVLAVSDSLVLGPKSDGVLIVADASTTRKAAAAHTREQLEQVGGNIVGCILNNFDPSQATYYPYENSYYYSSYEYQEGAQPRSRSAGNGSGDADVRGASSPATEQIWPPGR